MPKTEKAKISITMPKDLLKRIEDYRKTQSTIRSKSEIIAKLLDKALKVEGF